MKTFKYKLRLEGLNSAEGTISTRALYELLKQFTSFAERGLRLAIEGHGTKTGPSPKWLEKATYFTFTGIEIGSTLLDIEAPVLEEAIPDLDFQKDLWGKVPEPQDTAISFISRSVRDMSIENLESDYYDASVLTSLLEMKQFFIEHAKKIDIHCEERITEDFLIDLPVIEKVEKLKIRIPESRALMLSGILEQIRYSKKRFQLAMSNGQVIPGQINEEYIDVEELRNLWGKKVSIKGLVHFKPSGRIRLLEAQMLKLMTGGEEIFEVVPITQTEFEFTRTVATESTRRDWLKTLTGQWPGDESIDELINELEYR
jgi:hypothetical protein